MEEIKVKSLKNKNIFFPSINPTSPKKLVKIAEVENSLLSKPSLSISKKHSEYHQQQYNMHTDSHNYGGISYNKNEIKDLTRISTEKVKLNFMRLGSNQSAFNPAFNHKLSKVNFTESQDNPGPLKFKILTKEEAEERRRYSKRSSTKNCFENLKTEESQVLLNNNNNRILKQKILDRLEDKIESENFKLKVLNSEANYSIMENFLFKDKKSGLFNINDFDSQFQTTDYSNPMAFNKFFNKYSVHNELLRKNVIKKETPSFTFINEIKAHKKIPNPLGLIKKDGDPHELNLNYYSTGDDYVNVISKSIIKAETEHVKTLCLDQNRLSFNGLKNMLYNLRLNKRTVKAIRKLDLTNNLLSNKASEVLSEYIREKECSLKELILEKTGLTDSGVKEICLAIVDSLLDYLCNFNFADNRLTDECLPAICEVIEKCEITLRVIQLHKNTFSNSGAAMLVKAICKNPEVKFLNLSHNKLGDNLENLLTKEELYKSGNPLRTTFRNYDLTEFSKTMKLKFSDIVLPSAQNEGKSGKGGGGGGNSKKETKPDYFKCLEFQAKLKLPETTISPFAEALGEMFNTRKSTLYHLDISHNNLNYKDCLHLEESVKENHTILGIHVDGNDMTIDELGFICAVPKASRKANNYCSNQINYETSFTKHKGIFIGNPLYKSRIEQIREIRMKNSCWICENWRETAFTLDLEQLKCLKELCVNNKPSNYSTANINSNNNNNNTAFAGSAVKVNSENGLKLSRDTTKNNYLNTDGSLQSHVQGSVVGGARKSDNLLFGSSKNLAEKDKIMISSDYQPSERSKKSGSNVKSFNNLQKQEVVDVYKLHLSFERYCGYEINAKVKDNKLTIHRMCPPGETKYFFSLNNQFIENKDNNEMQVEYLEKPLYIEIPEEKTDKDLSICKGNLTGNKSYTKFNITLNSKDMMLNSTLKDKTTNPQTKINFSNSLQIKTSQKNVASSNTGVLPLLAKTKQSFNNNKQFETTEILNIKKDILSTNCTGEGFFSSNVNYIVVNSVTKRIISPDSGIIDNMWINHLRVCHPRPRKEIEITERVRTPWSFPISIWAKQFYYELEGEPEDAYYTAFDYDFNRCNFIKDVKNSKEELLALKSMLWEYYKQLLIMYKNVSSYSGLSIWQIQQSTLLDLMNRCNNFFDNYSKDFLLLKVETVKMSDYEEKRKKNKNVPDNIVRHQLLNFFVKIAIDKYCINLKIFRNTIDAVKYCFEYHYSELLNDFVDPQVWRKAKFYNEQVDNFIQAHLPLFYALYKTWASKKDQGRKDKSMTLDDFSGFVSSLVDKDLQVRDIPLFFNQAIHIQENEIDFERHYTMNFPEFIEAMCRIIDKAVSKDVLLIEKLEIYKQAFQKLISPSQEFKQIKEKFTLPKKNTELDLYEFDKNSPFYQGILFPPEKDLREYRQAYAKSTKNLREFNLSYHEKKSNKNKESSQVLDSESGQEETNEDNRYFTGNTGNAGNAGNMENISEKQDGSELSLDPIQEINSEARLI